MEKLGGHLRFQVEHEMDGIMFSAGLFLADNEIDWQGGMVIIRAEPLAEAKGIATSDTMHKCGVRKFEVRPWLLNEGTLTAKISCSDGGDRSLRCQGAQKTPWCFVQRLTAGGGDSQTFPSLNTGHSIVSDHVRLHHDHHSFF